MDTFATLLSLSGLRNALGPSETAFYSISWYFLGLFHNITERLSACKDVDEVGQPSYFWTHTEL